MGVLGYSTTPGSNNNALTGVGSLAENVMPIKQINDAMRQQVADIAQLYSDVVTGIYTAGTSSAYLVATASGHTAYNNTMALRLRFHVDSVAGAVTVNINGLGAKGLKIFATTGARDPAIGEIKADMAYDCVYIAALNCVVVTDPVVPAVDLSSRQPLDSDLTAIANLGVSDLGFVIRDGVGVMITHPYASLAEAQAGVATNRVMNPLRTADAIAALAGSGWIIKETIDCSSGINKETATFVVGKDYRFVFVGVSSASGSPTIDVAWFGETAAAYTANRNFTDGIAAANFLFGEFAYDAPRLSRKVHNIYGVGQATATSSASDQTFEHIPGRQGAGVNYATAQGVSKCRFTPSGAIAFDGGVILVLEK